LSRVFSKIMPLSGREHWKDLNSIMVYRRKCMEGDTATVSTGYDIGSLALDTRARAIRGHWPIGHNVHRRLEVCFDEDADRARRNHAAKNLSSLRKTALYFP
jgi:hypothetical protein